jgi:acylphosphatase
MNITIKVIGKVQGVFFRASTKAVADQMGVKGRVKNEKDGSVLIEAQADETTLNLFVEWCKEGPEKAKVEEVIVENSEVQNFTNFVVIKKNLLW